MPAVDISGVGVSYHGVSVLGGVDLSVAAGESVAVLGRSGSGKSTLLHVIAGLHRPTTGTVVVGGQPLWELSRDARTRWRRRHVGLVFQSSLLLADLTLAENTAMPLMLQGVRRREAVHRAEALLRDLGVAEEAGRVAGEVSGGQAQRAAVARALIANPALVLADEPTGALDSTNATLVVDLLLSSARAHGAALVTVTHDESVAARFDRVVHIRDGRLEE